MTAQRDSRTEQRDRPLEEDDVVQRRESATQRVAAGVITLIVMAAAAGLLGPGPLSHSTRTADGGTVAVHYLRFARRGGTAGLTIEAAPDLVVDGSLQIRISRDYLAAMRLDSITPEPAEEVLDGADLRLTIPVSGDHRASVTLSLTPQAMGSVAGTIQVGDAPAIGLEQYFYP